MTAPPNRSNRQQLPRNGRRLGVVPIAALVVAAVALLTVARRLSCDCHGGINNSVDDGGSGDAFAVEQQPPRFVPPPGIVVLVNAPKDGAKAKGKRGGNAGGAAGSSWLAPLMAPLGVGVGSGGGGAAANAAAKPPDRLDRSLLPGTFAAEAAAEEAARARVDLSLAHRLLPLTNLSAVTTAALLDAYPGLSPTEARELVQLQQELHCRAIVGQPDPPGSARVTFGASATTVMLVYARDDVVSDSLRGKARAWESEAIDQMLYALRAPVPPPGFNASVSSRHLWRRTAAPLAVDVGANVGWFALNAAAAGARVAAFEAMASNAALLRASLCANPLLMARTALYATGLGASRTECHIVSDAKNRGDGHTVCGAKDAAAVAAEWTARTGRTYAVRGAISVARLDALVAEDVQFAKLDVEGFELDVLKGAERLLRDHRVWHVMAECDAALVGEAGVAALLRLLDASGYYVSSFGFRGPYISSRRIRRGQQGSLLQLPSVTVYAVLRSLRDAEFAATGLQRRPTREP